MGISIEMGKSEDRGACTGSIFKMSKTNQDPAMSRNILVAAAALRAHISRHGREDVTDAVANGELRHMKCHSYSHRTSLSCKLSTSFGALWYRVDVSVVVLALHLFQ
eukprot:SAG31_NODE_271_length_18717_cov_8.685949_2_plen_107_part_00